MQATIQGLTAAEQASMNLSLNGEQVTVIEINTVLRRFEIATVLLDDGTTVNISVSKLVFAEQQAA